MKVTRIIKKIFIIILVILGLLGFSFLSDNSITTTLFKVEAACCPGPGCGPGTCFGTRINPPGGCGCYFTATEGCGGGCNPPPPPCTTSAPGAVTLSLPANGSKIDNNTLTVSWSGPGGWGKGCPNNNSYKVFLSPNCTGSYFSPTGAFFGSSQVLSNLTWGTTYCWLVQTNNGAIQTNSAVWSFSINGTPTVTNSGIVKDICGNGISGIGNQSGVTNPITYQVTLADPLIGDPTFPHTYQEIWIAMVPAANTAITPFFDNQPNDTEANINSIVANSKAIAAKISLVNNRLYTLQNATTWDNGITSGDDTNAFGTATILGYGSTTTAAVNGKNLTANFQIRFENSPNTFTSARYNIYVAALIKTSAGVLVTSYATGTNPKMYHRVNATATQQTWGVDLTPPSVPIGTVQYNNNGSFTLKDTITDNNVNDSGIRDSNISASIYANVSGTIVQPINSPSGNPPIPTSSPGISFQIISPVTGTIKPSYTINPNFLDMTKTLHAGYTIPITAKDLACNSTTQATPIGQPIPWLVSYKGSISTNTQLPGMSLPLTYNPVPPVIPSVGNPPYFSTYSALAGAGLPFPPSQQNQASQQKESAVGYNNQAVSPPDGTASWYNYFLNLIKNNYSGSILTFNVNSANNTISSHLGISSNNANVVIGQVNGNISIASNTLCDEKAVIFINGKLTINPNFTINNNTNGCIFIASDNITIGNSITSNIPLGSNASAPYESIYAQLVTDKTFITNASFNSATYPNKGVGLYINGGVIANNSLMLRDLNYIGNSGQPSQIFEYDPRYRVLFKDIFADTKYSLREVTN